MDSKDVVNNFISSQIYTNHQGLTQAENVDKSLKKVVDNLYAGKQETDAQLATIGSDVDELKENNVSKNEFNAVVIKVDSLGYYAEGKDYIRVCLDNQNRLVVGIKDNGDVVFGNGMPTTIREAINNISAIKVDKAIGKSLISSDVAESVEFQSNGTYAQCVTDSEGKILEGLSVEGEKIINVPIVHEGVREYGENSGLYLYALTDKDGKIVFAIDKNGCVHIPSLSQSTIESNLSKKNKKTHFKIDSLNDSFATDLNCKIIGDKGADSAKYIFNLDVEENANIRFKFRITESILKSKKTGIFASFDVADIKPTYSELQQYTESVSISGETKTVYYPTITGGVRFATKCNYNLNVDYAFSVRYVGDSTDVTISNNGSALIFKIDGVASEYSFANYTDVYSLYKAIELNDAFEVTYKELCGHTCTDLLPFPECKLVSTFYSQSGNLVYENASAPFFVPYSVDNVWHQVEIVKIGNDLYYNVDGCKYIKTGYRGNNVLTLGGNVGVQFKDVEISLNSTLDAEISKDIIISSVSPCLVILEGHGMYDKPMEEIDASGAYTQEGMGTSTDRLHYLFRSMIRRGYVPVSTNDIADYYNRHKMLPKRCFTIIFDDKRWDNCLKFEFLKVFAEFNVRFNLAVIYKDNEITFNNKPITPKDASYICRLNNCNLLNHLDHEEVTVTNPAELVGKIQRDVLNAENIGIEGMIIVYPSGWHNLYTRSVFKWLGIKLGIAVVNEPRHNPLDESRYNLKRVDVGARVTTASIIDKLY